MKKKKSMWAEMSKKDASKSQDLSLDAVLGPDASVDPMEKKADFKSRPQFQNASTPKGFPKKFGK